MSILATPANCGNIRLFSLTDAPNPALAEKFVNAYVQREQKDSTLEWSGVTYHNVLYQLTAGTSRLYRTMEDLRGSEYYNVVSWLIAEGYFRLNSMICKVSNTESEKTESVHLLATEKLKELFAERSL